MTEYMKNRLNAQASVLVDAQTDLKTAIKKGVLGNAPLSAIKGEVKRIIGRAINRIRSPTLREDARISLMRFSERLYGEMRDALGGIPPTAVPFVCVLMREITGGDTGVETFRPRTSEGREAMKRLVNGGQLSFETFQCGVPLDMFGKEYMDKVRDALNRLSEANAMDPNDFSGRNSLRNLAEMQVRYEAHQRSIEELRSSGARLVVCSSHGDCSDRCAPWQGRIYSLDGTSGTTEDGKKYVPLEEATDIYYTTKAGRVYKNGLLGFNCRHELFPYKAGMELPYVSKEQQKREYAVTQAQRKMEREIILAREKALAYKGEDLSLYRKWRDIAIARNRRYIRFSRENKRAFYPDRVKIL